MKNGYNNRSNGGNGGGNGGNTYNRDTDESFFEESYSTNMFSNHAAMNGEIWLKCDDLDRYDPSEMTFQGRLHQKNIKTKKWQAYHFELYSDRLIRMAVTHQVVQQLQQGNNTTTSNNATTPASSGIGESDRNSAEYLPLNACYLKKIKYSDTSYSNYKFGIRLQKGELKSELFTESAENFNKLYDEIKRFCILPKFAKKYKILAKFKSSSSANHLYKCFRYSDSMQYCVRIIDKYTLSESARLAVLKETAILRKIDHPSLVKLYEVYEDESNIFLIYELFQGKDLKSKMNDLLCMDEKTVSDFIWKLLHGLHHMHSRNVMHRDISFENIFFRTPNNITDVCLSNFAAADFIDYSKCAQGMTQYPNTTTLPKQPTRKQSMPRQIAPEMLRNLNSSNISSNSNNNSRIGSTAAAATCDAKVDIFAIGVIFYFIVFGRMPFEGKDLEDSAKLNEVCEIDYTTTPPFYGKFSSSAFDLMKHMLDKDPKQRSDAQLLMNHTWFVIMRNRGEDGKSRSSSNGGGYGFPTLTTVEENTEGADLVSEYMIDSRIGYGSSVVGGNQQNSHGANISLHNSGGGDYDYRLKDSSKLFHDSLTKSPPSSHIKQHFSMKKSTHSMEIFDEFRDVKGDANVIGSNYVFNIIRDGSRVYEDEFNCETVHDKMIGLNKVQFMKVPSKPRHDNFHYHLQTRLGINIRELYNNNPQQSQQGQAINVLTISPKQQSINQSNYLMQPSSPKRIGSTTSSQIFNLVSTSTQANSIDTASKLIDQDDSSTRLHLNTKNNQIQSLSFSAQSLS